MRFIVYGQSEAATALFGALKFARYDVRHISNKLFNPESPDTCDTAIVVQCRNKIEILSAYLDRGTRVFTLDTDAPDLPGYPVAVFESYNVGDYSLWGFLNHQTPDAYQNPEPGRLLCSFYTSGPIKLEKRSKPALPRLSEVLNSQSLSEAPRVWVIGGGPSLKGFDWSLLSGEVVIGANRAFEMPNVGITITIDPLFDRLSHNGDLGHESREKWRLYKGLKIYAACEDDPPRASDVILAHRVTNQADDVIPPRVDNIGKASNSGYAGVKLAWALGAKQIYCLGFDMAGVNGRTAWFHDGYPETWDDSIYRDYRAEMDAAAPHLAADGVQVTICGPTALTAFPTITLTEAAGLLSTKPIRPVVCGFYTRRTRYQQEAEAMARTATAFGLESSLIDVDSLGDWKSNTDQKPEAILKALRQHRDRAIAFVDADARFKAYPALFDAFAAGDSELGLSFFDWDAFPVDPRTGRELSSAVMLLKKTPAVESLIETWCVMVHGSSPEWEQRVLQDLLDSYVGPMPRIMDIPMRYNQIFDSMASLGLPVIEQTQASRRLKSEVAA